jgi:hypothetical protein
METLARTDGAGRGGGKAFLSHTSASPKCTCRLSPPPPPPSLENDAQSTNHSSSVSTSPPGKTLLLPNGRANSKAAIAAPQLLLAPSASPLGSDLRVKTSSPLPASLLVLQSFAHTLPFDTSIISA